MKLKLPVYSPDKKTILLELEVIFDDKFKDAVLAWNWKLLYQQGLWRVFKNTSDSNKKKTTHFFHSFVWELNYGKYDKTLVIDHIDGNSLNNKLENLRLISRKQNSYNTRPNKNGSSKYKGVHWNGKTNKWRAKIMFNSKALHLGSFLDEVQAARAYDSKAKELFGEYAYLNFKDS